MEKPKRRRGNRVKRHEKVCIICAKPFKAAQWYAKYCGKICRYKAQDLLTPRIHRDELERLKRAAGEL